MPLYVKLIILYAIVAVLDFVFQLGTFMNAKSHVDEDGCYVEGYSKDDLCEVICIFLIQGVFWILYLGVYILDELGFK